MMPTTHAGWIEYFTPKGVMAPVYATGGGGSQGGSIIVTPEEVNILVGRVKALRDAISASFLACNWSVPWDGTGQPPPRSPIIDQWAAQLQSVQTWIDAELTIINAWDQYDQGVELMTELNAWIDKLSHASQCSGIPMPPKANVPPPSGGLGGLASGATNSIDEIAKAITIGAVVIGGIWILGPALRTMASSAAAKRAGGG